MGEFHRISAHSVRIPEPWERARGSEERESEHGREKALRHVRRTWGRWAMGEKRSSGKKNGPSDQEGAKIDFFQEIRNLRAFDVGFEFKFHI